MPVTKTAKRALRSSKRKETVNKKIRTNLEVAIRIAKNSATGGSASGRKKSEEAILKAISLADRAAKKHLIHKNKVARIKSTLSKLLPHRAGPPVPRTFRFGEGTAGAKVKPKTPKSKAKKKKASVKK